MVVTLYSTNCPKCKILEKKLEQKNIEFNIITDIETMVQMGMLSAPILQIDDKKMNYLEAVQWVNGRE